MRYACAVLALVLMGAAWHPITVRPQTGQYTLRFYDWTRGCVRAIDGNWYGAQSGPELAVSSVLVFRNKLTFRDTMTTATIARDVYVKADYGGTLNVAVICWSEGAVPANATARLWVGPEVVVIPLAGAPKQNQIIYATAIPIFPAVEDAVYMITLSTDHMALAFMPENPAQYRVNFQLWVWIS